MFGLTVGLVSTVDSSQFTRAELPAVACRPLPSHQWLPHRHPLTSTLHCTDSDSDGDSDSSEVDNSDSDCSYGGLFLASAEGFELEQRHSWPVVTEIVVTVIVVSVTIVNVTVVTVSVVTLTLVTLTVVTV